MLNYLKNLFHKSRLRTKVMIFFIVVAGIPIFFGSAFNLTYFNTSILKSLKRNIEDKLHTAILLYDKKKSEIEKITISTANDNIVIINMELLLYPPISNYLKSKIRSSNLSFISILDKEGRLIISGNKNFFKAPENPVVEKHVLQNALKKRIFSLTTNVDSKDLLKIEQLNTGSLEKTRSIICLSPIYSYSNELLGYIISGYLLNNNNKNSSVVSLISEIRNNVDTNVLIVEKNIPLIYSEGPVKNFLFHFPDEFIVGKGTINEDEFHSVKVNNLSYIYKFAPATFSKDDLEIHIGIGAPENKFYAVRNRSVLIYAFITVVALLITVILAYFFSRSITSPVLSIVEGTRHIIQGDFNKKINVKSNDELGTLANSFNIMTKKLSRRIEMENLATDISKKFINLPISETDNEINRTINELSNYVSADKCCIYEISRDRESIIKLQEWEKYKSINGNYKDSRESVDKYPWLLEQIQVLDIVHVSSIDNLPVDAEKEKEEWLKMGIKSVIAAPMFYGEKLNGFIIFKFITEKDHTSIEDLRIIQMIAEIICNALERQKTEFVLTNARNYLKNLFNAQSSILISINPEGNIIEWNTAAEQFTGISIDDAIASNIWKTIPFLANYRECADVVMTSCEPISVMREVIEYEGKKYLDISFFPLAYKKNSDVVIRIDDKTEFEKKNEQLLQAQKMETVGTLAGGLAHDFNNVLTIIIGTLSIIKHNLNSGEYDIEKFIKYTDIISVSSNRAADMVKQLLTLSRKSELLLKQVDINEAIKNVIKIAKNTFDKSIDMSEEYCVNKAMVYADRTQIEQSILNVCVNAAHSMTLMRKKGEPHGGRMDINISKIFADRHFCASHTDVIADIDYFMIKISDTGIGMTRETVSKIFDPFFTTKKEGQGTGLGLAMVYNIFKEHKGFISVYSDIGTGTTFNLFLPQMKTIEDIDEDSNVMGKVPMGSGLILIIDDEKAVRDTACNILEECGYEVITAEDGYKGVDIFTKRHEDIKAVLLDLAMPKISGKETFIRLKKINPRVKVILTSGFKQDERVQEIMGLGINNFLQKPYTMLDLSSIIYKAIYNKNGITI